MDPGAHSVAFPRRWWYPVAQSSELGRRPLAVTLMDTPLVVFRGAGGTPAVVLDRCAHRNYPLSLGRVTGDGLLECGYHGWSYDGDGRCRAIPGLRQGRTQSTWHVPTYATVEQDGFVWAWGEPDTEPTRAPFALPVVDGPGAGQTVFRCDLDATLRAASENALDVPHTAFLHRGLFRGGAARTITAVRRPIDGRRGGPVPRRAGRHGADPAGRRTPVGRSITGTASCSPRSPRSSTPSRAGSGS